MKISSCKYNTLFSIFKASTPSWFQRIIDFSQSQWLFETSSESTLGIHSKRPKIGTRFQRIRHYKYLCYSIINTSPPKIGFVLVDGPTKIDWPFILWKRLRVAWCWACRSLPLRLSAAGGASPANNVEIWNRSFKDMLRMLLKWSLPTRWGCKMSHRKWNNRPNRPHWTVRLVCPVIPFPVRHSASPPGRESGFISWSPHMGICTLWSKFLSKRMCVSPNSDCKSEFHTTSWRTNCFTVYATLLQAKLPSTAALVYEKQPLFCTQQWIFLQKRDRETHKNVPGGKAECRTGNGTTGWTGPVASEACSAHYYISFATFCRPAR